MSAGHTSAIRGDLKVYGDDVQTHLQPGEALLALTNAALAYGATTDASPNAWETKVAQWTTKHLPQRDRTSFGARVGNAIAAGAFWSFDLPDGFLESRIGGRTCSGAPGSLARCVADAFDSSKGGGQFLAVTNQRILVIGREKRPVWAVPPGALLGAERRPRFLMRGRIGMVFADGSWIVLGTSPHIGSWHAKQIVAALGGKSVA